MKEKIQSQNQKDTMTFLKKDGKLQFLIKIQINMGV